MPLAFDSISHGSIAFGFFNIDSDMLLLEHYFLFADVFCKYVTELAEREDATAIEAFWQVYSIKHSQDIGDLMGAIYGVRYQGFVGDVYRKFPFPRNPENFKQKPEGMETRAVMDRMISKYASRVRIPFVGDIIGQTVKIGEYAFNRSSFQALIKYVWRGGYPRWKDEIRPDYVLAMKTKIEQHQMGLLEGLSFED